MSGAYTGKYSGLQWVTGAYRSVIGNYSVTRGMCIGTDRGLQGVKGMFIGADRGCTGDDR